MEDTATDRAFRIGQKIRYWCAKVSQGALKVRIDTMLQDKRTLADESLQEEKTLLLADKSRKIFKKFAHTVRKRW